jgi:Ca2+-binding RTX toxin-like protein
VTKRLQSIVAFTAVLVLTGLTPVPKAEAPKCFGEPATIVGTEGSDELKGTADADVIVGRGGVDTIDGQAGDDLICAGPSHRSEEDSVYAGEGDDKIDGQGHGDFIDGGPGADLLIGGGGGDYLEGGDGDDELRGGKRGDLLNGQEGSDVLVGATGGDTLLGEAGDDSLRGGAGLDWLAHSEFWGDYSYAALSVELDAGAGIAIAPDGTDTFSGLEAYLGSLDDDVLVGSQRAEILGGDAGDDIVQGRRGADVLHTAGYDPATMPQPDTDRLMGGAGRDWVVSVPTGASGGS